MVFGSFQDRQLALALMGRLLEYPSESYADSVEAARCFLDKHFHKPSKALQEFQKLILEMPLWRLEEIFTRTFDLAPICCPYVSAHLYGDESYDRGGFMAKLSSRYEEGGFDVKGEMPDHLGAILRFAPLFTSEEFAELTQFCLLNPVKEMSASLKDGENPFFYLLETISQLLAVDLSGEHSL